MKGSLIDLVGLVRHVRSAIRYFNCLGNRSRNGSLYYKAEGYHEAMHLLYRGGWKDNQYHGKAAI